MRKCTVSVQSWPDGRYSLNRLVGTIHSDFYISIIITLGGFPPCVQLVICSQARAASPRHSSVMTPLLIRRISATGINAFSLRLCNAILSPPSPLRGEWPSHIRAFVQRACASRTPTRTNLWRTPARRSQSTTTAATTTKASEAAPKPLPNRISSGEAGPLAQRLLIYYAGKRTVYLGTLKLYTVMLFSYATLLVAPPLFRQGGDSNSDGDEGDAAKTAGSGDSILPHWAAPVALILGSLVPLVFVQYTRSTPSLHFYFCFTPVVLALSLRLALTGMAGNEMAHWRGTVADRRRCGGGAVPRT